MIKQISEALPIAIQLLSHLFAQYKPYIVTIPSTYNHETTPKTSP